MSRTQFNILAEDVKRPIRKMAHALGIKRQLSNEELVAKHGPVVEYEGNLFDIHHPRCNALIGGSILKNSYERMEIEMIRDLISKDDRVIELGACMGVTSLILYDLLSREQHIVIEADRRNLAMAKHMFDLNGKDVRTQFGILAAGDNIEREMQFSSNANASSSSMYDRDGGEIVEAVPCLQFEDVIAQEQATAIVLDIEGGEYDLFTQATSFGSLRKLILEAHPAILGDAKMAEMMAVFDREGFKIHFNIDDQFLVLTR